MADRSIVVKFRADVSDLQAKAKAGAQAIQGVGDAADRASKTSGSKLALIGTGLSKGLDKVEKNSQHINTLGNGFLTLGVAAAAGVGVAIKKFADFDASMSLVAASGQDARDNLDALRQAAIDAGAQTAFSATEAAGGIEALAKAGVSAQDTLGGGLKGALDLAAAGNLGVAGSAETAATAMTQFGLAGTDVPHIADLLAAAAGKAQGEVSDFAGALNQSGLVASQFGLSIEETTGTLAAFASAGLLGSDAGTSFKTMLLRLANPSKEAAETMKDLGINAYDAQGQFVGIESLAGQLQKSMGGLSDAQRDAALSTIFGSDAIRAANVLYQQGSAGIQQWTANVNDAGFAAETAAIRMDNLKGDFEQFTGSLETAFIGAGSGGNDFLRELTQGATDAVNSFNQLPSSVQEGSLRILALGAGAALAIGGLAKLAVGVAATRTALMSLGVTAVGTRARLAALNGAGLLAVAGFVAVQAAAAAMSSELEKNSAGIDGYKESLSELGRSGSELDSQFSSFGSSFALLGQGVGDSQSAFVALQDTLNPVSQGFRKVGDALGMASTAGILADEFDKIDQALVSMDPDKAAAAFSRLSDQATAAGLSTDQINATFDDYKKKQQEAADAAVSSFRSSEIAFTNGAASVGKVGAAAQQSAEDLKALNDAMYASANAALAMSGNAIAIEAAMDAANASAKENGKTLDINTAKGRANQSALDSLASATLTTTQAMVENGDAATRIVATNERAKASYIATARAMGAEKDEAIAMADALFQIPTNIKSQVVVAGAKVSKADAKELNAALKDIPAEQRARIVTIAETKGAKAAYTEMAKVKSKEVIAKATGKGVNTVKEIDGAIKKLKSKEVQAQAKAAGKPAVDALDKAIRDLKNKRVQVTAATSGQGSLSALQSAIGAVRGKTVYVTVKRREQGGGDAAGATGGLFAGGGFSMRGPLRRSSGGPVWGAGTATSDSIPALLSNGEFVINARSVSMIGADRLAHMNQTGSLPGFAVGGAVGSGIPAGVDINMIWRLITAVTRPLAAVVATNAALGRARTAKYKEDAEVRAAGRAVKSGGATKAEKANLAKQLAEQKTATENLKTATANLADAQRAVADQARAQSESFAGRYRSTSTDPMDWIESLRRGASELKAFQTDLLRLRKLGVSETIVQQISNMAEQDASAASELAKSILTGGKALAGALNTANGNLQKVADGLGYDVVQATGRYATGGPISGPGSGTSDSILARVSNGEYVVNARSTALNRGMLDAINYGRQSSHTPRFAAGGYVSGRAGFNPAMIAAAIEDGLSRASFTGYVDGQPFRMIVNSELRQRGRQGMRTK